MKKLFLVLTFIVFTGLNVMYTAPWTASACQCFAPGGGSCTGQCCALIEGACYCWDKGPGGLC